MHMNVGWFTYKFQCFFLFFLHLNIFNIFKSQPMHYRLSSIKGVPFRFTNFASHFISVQIFQMDFSTLSLFLSASNYFRYIYRRRNEHFSISISHYHHAIDTFVKQQKGTSWALLIFDASNLRSNICKPLFVILEHQFDHEVGPIQHCYFELFFSV